MSIVTPVDISKVQPGCGLYFHTSMLLTRPTSTVAEPVPLRILTLLTPPSSLTKYVTLGKRFSRLKIELGCFLKNVRRYLFLRLC